MQRQRVLGDRRALRRRPLERRPATTRACAPPAPDPESPRRRATARGSARPAAGRCGGPSRAHGTRPGRGGSSRSSAARRAGAARCPDTRSGRRSVPASSWLEHVLVARRRRVQRPTAGAAGSLRRRRSAPAPRAPCAAAPDRSAGRSCAWPPRRAARQGPPSHRAPADTASPLKRRVALVDQLVAATSDDHGVRRRRRGSCRASGRTARASRRRGARRRSARRNSGLSRSERRRSRRARAPDARPPPRASHSGCRNARRNASSPSPMRPPNSTSRSRSECRQR